MTLSYNRIPPWAYLLKLPVGNGVIELTADNVPVGDIEQQYFTIHRSSSNFEWDHQSMITDLCGSCFVNGEHVNGNTYIDHGSKIYLHRIGKEYIFVDCEVSDKILRQIGLNESHAVAHILGEGTFGAVHLCFEKRSTEAFALKVTKEGNDRERDIVFKLHHPNLVRVHFFQFVGRMAFIGMEYMAGGDLSTFVYPNCESLSIGQTKLIFYQIVEAVCYLHNYGICHRDLKPANILLHHPNPHTLVKLTDFGISKSELLHSPMDSVIGTPCFLAPEILQGVNYTKKVDVWSLGVILYMSLTGRALGKDGVLLALLPNNIRSVRNLLQKMLQMNPNSRISIEEVALHIWLQDSNVKRQIAALRMEHQNGYGPKNSQKIPLRITTSRPAVAQAFQRRIKREPETQALITSTTELQQELETRALVTSKPQVVQNEHIGIEAAIASILCVGILFLFVIL